MRKSFKENNNFVVFKSFLNIFKQNKKFLILFYIFILFLLLLSINYTFSYFATKITGSPKVLSGLSINIILNFSDNNNSVIEHDVLTNWSFSKTFTVTNNTSSDYTYNIMFDDFINTYPSGSIQYKLVCTSNNCTSTKFSSMTEFQDMVRVNTPFDYPLGYLINISAGATETFELYLRHNPSITAEEGKVVQGDISIWPGNIVKHIVSLTVYKGDEVIDSSITTNDGTDATLEINRSGYSVENAQVSGDGCTLNESKTSVVVTSVSKSVTCIVTGLVPLPYYIHYNCGGHSGSMPNTEVPGTSTVATLDPNACEDLITTGSSGNISHFKNWVQSTNSSITYNNGQNVLLSDFDSNRDLYLTATWENLFSIDGNYSVFDDGSGNWRVKIFGATGYNYGNATITFNTSAYIDIFMIGSGGGAGTGAGDAYGGNGGPAYNSTSFGERVDATSYNVTIAEGVINTGGNQTTGFSLLANGGGRGGNGYYTNDIYYPGYGWVQSAHTGSTGGGGSAVYEFGAASGTLYCYGASYGTAGPNNSGVGGGGYWGNYNYGSKSGSGIIVFRNARG